MSDKLYPHERRYEAMRDAAPDLYEAAEYALGVIATTNRFDAEQCQAAADALIEALAKARGQA